ncbi:hypothetical protein LCGC14_1835890 [marine sediment metagenome]|uniref:Uncharacterized protein n=1 Tax=marine sediment metagenome TaxID=412755 RepID=A0A0F9JE97_9ZZZZ
MKQLGANEIEEHRNWCLVVEIENDDLIGYPAEAAVCIDKMLEQFINTFAEPIDQTRLHLCFAESGGHCCWRCIN